jgi:hypothetical protein
MVNRGYFEGMSKAHIEGMYRDKYGVNKALAVSRI